jgi:glutathione S-transferase
VPTLELDDGRRSSSQSMAIIEYLDETHPQPPLLPATPVGRAQVRALAQLIACEIHPLNNLRVLKYLVRDLKVDEEAKNAWYRHWVRDGLEKYERELQRLPAAATATATRRRWPTAAWCRRSSTASASTSTSAGCRAPWAPSRPACSTRPSRRRSPPAARTTKPERHAIRTGPTGRPPSVRAACSTRDGGVSVAARTQR